MPEEYPTPEFPPSKPETRVPPARSTPGSASHDVRDVEFPVVLRGYDRGAVDAYVEEVAQMVAGLESTQSRDAVVKAALDDVGEHTGGILKKAHEAADEITSRSRSQAEGRLQGAQAEAEALVREAEQRAQELEADLIELWDERTRLIEDLRQLSDQVLALADDAGARLQPPRGEETTGESDALSVAEGEQVVAGAPEPADAASDASAVDQPTVESAAARPEPADDEDGQDAGPGAHTPLGRTG